MPTTQILPARRTQRQPQILSTKERLFLFMGAEYSSELMPNENYQCTT